MIPFLQLCSYLVACLIWQLITAPVAYEDEDGFHFGTPDDVTSRKD